jgi:hypothetical protein
MEQEARFINSPVVPSDRVSGKRHYNSSLTRNNINPPYEAGPKMKISSLNVSTENFGASLELPSTKLT